MKREKPKRKPGHKANYQGATPEQVARAFYWHRRRKIVITPHGQDARDHSK